VCKATAYHSEIKHVRSLPVADHLTPGMLEVVVYSWSSVETVMVVERCGEMVCPRLFQRHPRNSCSRCRRDNSTYIYPYSLTPEVTCHWRPETHTSPLRRLSHPIMESLHGIDSARRMALLSIKHSSNRSWETQLRLGSSGWLSRYALPRAPPLKCSSLYSPHGISAAQQYPYTMRKALNSVVW
jgi:hypothetical protein